MTYLKRDIEKDILDIFFKNKAIIIYGARQVGKTTMIESILKTYIQKNEVLFLNGDELDIRQSLSTYSEIKLRNLIGDKQIVYIDEAQRISDIGVIIKIMIDRIKNVQVIASGSSALELSGGISEPLTGRKYEIHLYPFSFNELLAKNGLLDEKRLLERRLLYGCYPNIVTDMNNSKRNIKSLAGSYLYKDILALENIKKPIVLEKLLNLLALQIGSEVNSSELALNLGINKITIEKYIDLLEKSYIIFSLQALSKNVRNEIKKGRKIYFYDCGIRNAVIGNFLPLSNRNDVGALWENFIISERIKYLRNNNMDKSSYFWRTTQQQEIDYIEEENDSYDTYEIKWNPKKKAKLSKTFSNKYEKHSFKVINRDNYEEFL